jgi:hypothetical protein
MYDKNNPRNRAVHVTATTAGQASRAARKQKNKGEKVLSVKRLNPARGLNLAPLRKVMKEAGTRKVRVMRSKSGKPTGVKFL